MPPLPTSRQHAEWDSDGAPGMAQCWGMLVEQADEELPISFPHSVTAAAAAAAALHQPQQKQATIKLRRGAAEDASLKLVSAAAVRLLESLSGGQQLISKITQRLLVMMAGMSHSALCGALRAVGGWLRAGAAGWCWYCWLEPAECAACADGFRKQDVLLLAGAAGWSMLVVLVVLWAGVCRMRCLC